MVDFSNKDFTDVDVLNEEIRLYENKVADIKEGIEIANEIGRETSLSDLLPDYQYVLDELYKFKNKLLKVKYN